MSQQWSSPVKLIFSEGSPYRVGDTFVATDCLLRRWPEKSGVFYRKARSACLEALEGRVPAYYAREAFIIAARDAGVLVVEHDLAS